ncbi:MAG: single-stranded DNA-binding protein [Candidatus Competibacter sp.]|nr:single-stranded DNA-binding protein [Candidatus Competibacter sp.]
MIRALVSGVLYEAPRVHTGKSGKPFTTAKVRADGKDGAAVWCSLIAFNAEGERLATLPANAALSVSGRAEVSAWLDKSGEPRAGLSLVVDELATLKAKPKPRDDGHQQRRSARQPAPAGADFDDMDLWQP